MSFLAWLPPKWAKLQLHFIVTMLMTQALPARAKGLIRALTPKLAPEEARWLALAHNVFGFASEVTANCLMSRLIVLAATGLLPPQAAAARAPGAGCNDIALQEMAAAEGAMESRPMLIKSKAGTMKLFS